MTTPTSGRLLGLSPRARRFVLPMFGVAIAVIVVGTVVNRGSGGGAGTDPVVGSDLHSVAELGDQLFVSGHGGAGYRVRTGGWTQIDTLDDKDIMGWAQSGSALFAGGHAGLYRSVDDGETFTAMSGLPMSDVHALGASGERVYLGSPEVGIVVSDDGGASFMPVGDAGRDFMGTIWVDPTNPDIAIAPSMQSGAVRTTDGGVTWDPLGSSSGSMAVAVDSKGQNLVAIDVEGAQVSSDGGKTWSALDVPDATSAATYTSDGELVVAALVGARAAVYKEVSGKWDPLT